MNEVDKPAEELSRELQALRGEYAALKARYEQSLAERSRGEEALAQAGENVRVLPDSSSEAGRPLDDQKIRQLFEEYLRKYLSRDDRLTADFSENFSGFTGGGDFLVKDRAQWVAITRQDFAQIKDPIRVELKDLAVQALAETIAVATGFFAIHLPIKDHILSRETARLVLIFRREPLGWKISHSSISIPYALVREGEIYPLKELVDRNQLLEKLVAERTTQLSEAIANLRRTNEELAREIAERKQVEEALQRSEERYRSIVTASPDDITITDMECRILMVSPAAVTMFGFNREEDGLGRLLTDFIVPDDRARATFHISQKCQGIVTGPNEYRGLRHDGSTFAIEANSEFIRNGQGMPVGMVFIVRDITERKKAEAEKEKLEAYNRQLQKAESLGRMAGAIAHHFNNQLQAVMLSLEMATSDLPQNLASDENLNSAMQAARKAAEVSNLMLTYLGQTAAKREPLDLSEVCLRSLPLLRAVMPRNLVLETDLPSPGPVIQADLNQIQHVLTNLVTNAWEAGGVAGSTIRLAVKTVAAAEISATRRFPVACQLQDAAYACLEVADAGCGISDRDLERIFDPFFSSKFPGRGMGLAVVLGVARALNGGITVESEPGRGSIFRVFFPVSALPVSQRPIQPAEGAPTAGGGTVLVIEDEPAVRKGVTLALRRSGITVLPAEDGVEAVEIFRQHQDEIGCVLCDLTMPRMDGWQTLTALRRLAPGIPVILASGYSEAQVMAGDHPELPQLILHKPYEAKALLEAISRAMTSRTTP